MKAALDGIVKFLARSNLFIAAGAASYASVAYLAFGKVPDIFLIILVFGGTAIVYNAQRLLSGIRNRNSNTIQLIVIGVLLYPVLISAWNLPFPVTAIYAGACLIALAYVLPFWPKRPGRWALRDVPYMKMPVVVIVWLLAGVAGPVVESGLYLKVPAYALALFALQQGVLIAVLAVCFDIRDLRTDRPSQRTIPQVMGLPQTRLLLANGLTISGLASAYLYLTGFANLPGLLSHIIALWLVWICIKRLNPDSPDWYFDIWADGALLVQATGFWIASIIET